MSINGKQFSAFHDFCYLVAEGGFYDKDWLMEHITVKLDDITKTVTIEIWDMDEQEFNDFVEYASLTTG